MTKVKICGITNLDDARASIDCGADYLGFVLSDSPRRVWHRELEIMCAELNSDCKTVGVFAHEDDLFDFVQECDAELDYFQVYFDVVDGFMRQPREGWIRAHLVQNNDAPLTVSYSQPTLLDFKNSSLELRGAELLRDVDAVGNAVILAGNLSPSVVGNVVRQYQPWGVDVARGVESTPGKKDHELIRRFIESVRHAD